MDLHRAVIRLVARDTSLWLDDDDESLDMIVTDVAQRWRERQPGGDDPAELEAFWNQYANRVEWASPGSGDQYRAEFCPAEARESFDTGDYFHAVWTAHVAELRASTSPAAAA